MGRGEILALLCAVVWASAVIMFKRVGERVPAFQLNLFKNALGTLCFLATILLVVALVGPSASDAPSGGGLTGWLTDYGLAPAWGPISWRDFGLLCVSGIIGITIADTMLLHALQLLGAGRMAVVDCLYTPSMILCAVVMLADRPTLGQLAGAVLVVLGVLVVGFQPGDGRTRAQVRRGIAFGAGSMLLMAFALVVVKPMLQTMPLLQFTWLRLAASVVAALIFLVATGRLREMDWVRGMFGGPEPPAPRIPHPEPRIPQLEPRIPPPKPRNPMPWGWLVLGSWLGAYLGMGLWIAGFKYAGVATVAVLNQTSVFFILILATIFLKEKLTLRKVLGMCLGASGVLLATLV